VGSVRRFAPNLSLCRQSLGGHHPNGERIAGTLVRKEVTKVNFVEEMIHPAVPCPFPFPSLFLVSCFLFLPSCARAQTAKMMEAPPISNLARPFWLIKVNS
jgi:hypothetical protein